VTAGPDGSGAQQPAVGGAIVVEGWRKQPHAGLYAALFLASAGLLTLEISLTRLFSFTIWYHLTYLTISMALLGFSASGAVVASYPDLFRSRGHRRLVSLVVAGAILTLVALVFFARFPLDVL